MIEPKTADPIYSISVSGVGRKQNSGTQPPQPDFNALFRHTHGKRRNACRPATRHGMKREATKTSSVTQTHHIASPNHIGGESVRSSRSKKPHFMRWKLKIYVLIRSIINLSQPEPILKFRNHAVIWISLFTGKPIPALLLRKPFNRIA